MLSLFEKKEQLFGEFRTGVFTNNKRDIQTTISAMKNGKCFVTNGPFIKITCYANEKMYDTGNTIHGNRGSLNIHIISTPEFGYIKKITVKKGIIGSKAEINYFTVKNQRIYELENNIEIVIDSDCYFRSEVELESNVDKKRFALTNPIWFKFIK